MPTVRRRRSRALAAPRIPQAAVDAYRLARSIEDSGAADAWERDGGRHREYLDAYSALRTALDIRPWHPTPLDVDGPEPAEITGPGRGWWDGWPRAWQLRVALEGAADADE
jgi:hypothetical protein